VAERTDSPFLAWLSGLSGPLDVHQSRLLVGALIDCLRASAEHRRRWHAHVYRYWNTRPSLLRTTLLSGDRMRFERLMANVREPPPLGRPNEDDRRLVLRVHYAPLVFWAGSLSQRDHELDLTEFRREINKVYEQLMEARHLTSGRRPPLLPATIARWYRFRLFEKPERLALELLAHVTGTPRPTLRKQISTRSLRRLPSAP
jgi:hypothetical protein